LTLMIQVLLNLRPVAIQFWNMEAGCS